MEIKSFKTYRFINKKGNRINNRNKKRIGNYNK